MGQINYYLYFNPLLSLYLVVYIYIWLSKVKFERQREINEGFVRG